ncbi:MAG: flavodoxin [Candidatus Coproplasma sp.]
MKTLIVYWSGTGNTETMANAVYDGATAAGADVKICPVSEVGDVAEYDVLLMGCPAMGAEELEGEEFEPFFSSIESCLKGKKIGLFGSYDWGDGEWMRTWQSRVEDAGGVMLTDGITAHTEPDEEALTACKELGKLAV